MTEPTAFNLANLSALITGANQGLGKEIAARFVRAGANVLLTARNTDLLEQVRSELQQLAKPTQRILTMKNDVADRASCDAVAAYALKEFPTLSILVNNAGVYGPKGAIEDVNWDEWIQAIEINLFGTVYMSRALIPHFKSQKHGKIINLSGEIGRASCR